MMIKKPHLKILLLILPLTVIVSSSFAYPIEQVPPFVTDPNAPQPTQKPPAKPPWDWSGAKEPIGLAPGDYIWIGCYNEYRPEHTKNMKVRINASWDDELEIESAVGYTPTGSTVNGTVDDPNGFTNTGSKGTYWVGEISFTPQPDWECVKIKNTSSNYNLLADIEITYWCYKCYVMGNQCDLYETTIGHTENTRAITKLLMTHTQATVDSLALPGLDDHTGLNTWDVTYTTTDPNTGDPLPQGGWLWTCTSGPGIGSGQPFDMTMKVLECMPEGQLELHVYDESEFAPRDWDIYYAQDDDPEPMTADIALPYDCMVTLPDFGVLAEHWLDGVY
ncbi:MAG: hypothetical protein OEV87_03230 [Phycisphaerae bacterium]|nr:hypothetical protein [Phycisphaerae bacterium]